MAVHCAFEYCMILQDALKSLKIKAEMAQHIDSNDTKAPIHCNFKTMSSSQRYATYQSVSIFNECLLNKIIFEITTFIPMNDDNVLFGYLNEAILNLLSANNDFIEPLIINVIIQYIKEPLAWNRQLHESKIVSDPPFYEASKEDIDSAINAFGYEYNDQLIRYKKEVVDALNVPATFEIDFHEYKGGHHRFIVHCCCLNKGDETWIGLMNKAGYVPTYSYPYCSENAVAFHGGRERRNEYDEKQSKIYLRGKQIYSSIDSLKNGDWISIVIEVEEDIFCVAFYVNGKRMGNFIDISTLGKEYTLLLYALVDAKEDAWFIEQSLNCNQLSDN